mmetsp:Transcript_4272/g.13548  ORF Transcript_4272/g.13548 Transcript_4272/m.13548 type:complete len:103 (+) Transcript_4272:62-370(+)
MTRSVKATIAHLTVGRGDGAAVRASHSAAASGESVPSGQDSQDTAPVPAAKRPAGHAEQPMDASRLEYRPAVQFSHFELPAAAEYRPAAQLPHDVAPGDDDT